MIPSKMLIWNHPAVVAHRRSFYRQNEEPQLLIYPSSNTPLPKASRFIKLRVFATPRKRPKEVQFLEANEEPLTAPSLLS